MKSVHHAPTTTTTTTYTLALTKFQHSTRTCFSSSASASSSSSSHRNLMWPPVHECCTYGCRQQTESYFRLGRREVNDDMAVIDIFQIQNAIRLLHSLIAVGLFALQFTSVPHPLTVSLYLPLFFFCLTIDFISFHAFSLITKHDNMRTNAERVLSPCMCVQVACYPNISNSACFSQLFGIYRVKCRVRRTSCANVCFHHHRWKIYLFLLRHSVYLFRRENLMCSEQRKFNHL